MTYPQVWGRGKIRALPVGRLQKRTMLNVSLGRSLCFRAGPWVPVEEDESRLVRIMSDETAVTRTVDDPPLPVHEEFLFHEVLPMPAEPVDLPGPAARSA